MINGNVSNASTRKKIATHQMLLSSLCLLRKMFIAKGFDIVAVSLDEKHDAWVKAMKDEGVTDTWPQLIEPKAFKSELTAAYQINGIPACLLFDPQGKLVTYNMRGSFMDNILIKLYGDHFKKKDMAAN